MDYFFVAVKGLIILIVVVNGGALDRGALLMPATRSPNLNLDLDL